MSDQEVLFEVKGAVGHIILNRPKALNALTLPMVRLIGPQMDKWAGDMAVKAVVISGAGDRAFCAGGDVAEIYRRKMVGDISLGRDFFREEYIVNRAIFRFPKPWIALLDGITMGGGVGLSVHGRFRIVTEKFLFAMPETGIGLFPDVGGGHFLPRLPGQLGMYLALTGQRLKAADGLYCGVATHFVSSDRILALQQALETMSGEGDGAVEAVLEKFTADAGAATLPPHRTMIDHHFGRDTVDSIVSSLAKDSSEWAQKTAGALARLSPTSMKITFKQIRDGGSMSFEDIMTMEYRMSQGCMNGHDFYEGVRAVLIDKDNAPKWQPATLAEVGEDIVARHFAPVSNDLFFK
ncbi:MAG: enoyl-CoA hydratase [Alphaproteobacteria bacterium]|jgi:enoyl-CoA hydratase|nr:enoyl-CoA hydratase [Alphaproteobacteria bacterium]